MFIGQLQILKTMEHNEQDKSEFSIKNIEQAAQIFFSLSSFKLKEIYAVTDQEKICLLRQNSLEEYPRNIIIQDIQNTDLYAECQRVAFFLYETLIKLHHKAYSEHMESILESPGAKMEQKQPSINYSKEIKKKIRICKKLFIDSRMEGYDFREVDLSEAVFINCSLAGANFSFVNLDTAVFINCNLTNAIWHKAWVKNTIVINGESKYLTNIINGDAYEKE